MSMKRDIEEILLNSRRAANLRREEQDDEALEEFDFFAPLDYSDQISPDDPTIWFPVRIDPVTKEGYVDYTSLPKRLLQESQRAPPAASTVANPSPSSQGDLPSLGSNTLDAERSTQGAPAAPVEAPADSRHEGPVQTASEHVIQTLDTHQLVEEALDAGVGAPSVATVAEKNAAESASDHLQETSNTNILTQVSLGPVGDEAHSAREVTAPVADGPMEALTEHPAHQQSDIQHSTSSDASIARAAASSANITVVSAEKHIETPLETLPAALVVEEPLQLASDAEEDTSSSDLHLGKQIDSGFAEPLPEEPSHVIPPPSAELLPTLHRTPDIACDCLHVASDATASDAQVGAELCDAVVRDVAEKSSVSNITESHSNDFGTQTAFSFKSTNMKMSMEPLPVIVATQSTVQFVSNETLTTTAVLQIQAETAQCARTVADEPSSASLLPTPQSAPLEVAHHDSIQFASDISGHDVHVSVEELTIADTSMTLSSLTTTFELDSSVVSSVSAAAAEEEKVVSRQGKASRKKAGKRRRRSAEPWEDSDDADEAYFTLRSASDDDDSDSEYEDCEAVEVSPQKGKKHSHKKTKKRPRDSEDEDFKPLVGRHTFPASRADKLDLRDICPEISVSLYQKVSQHWVLVGDGDQLSLGADRVVHLKVVAAPPISTPAFKDCELHLIRRHYGYYRYYDLKEIVTIKRVSCDSESTEFSALLRQPHKRNRFLVTLRHDETLHSGYSVEFCTHRHLKKRGRKPNVGAPSVATVAEKNAAAESASYHRKETPGVHLTTQDAPDPVGNGAHSTREATAAVAHEPTGALTEHPAHQQLGIQHSTSSDASIAGDAASSAHITVVSAEKHIATPSEKSSSAEVQAAPGFAYHGSLQSAPDVSGHDAHVSTEERAIADTSMALSSPTFELDNSSMSPVNAAAVEKKEGSRQEKGSHENVVKGCRSAEACTPAQSVDDDHEAEAVPRKRNGYHSNPKKRFRSAQNDSMNDDVGPAFLPSRADMVDLRDIWPQISLTLYHKVSTIWAPIAEGEQISVNKAGVVQLKIVAELPISTTTFTECEMHLIRKHKKVHYQYYDHEEIATIQRRSATVDSIEFTARLWQPYKSKRFLAAMRYKGVLFEGYSVEFGIRGGPKTQVGLKPFVGVAPVVDVTTDNVSSASQKDQVATVQQAASSETGKPVPSSSTAPAPPIASNTLQYSWMNQLLEKHCPGGLL